MSLRLHKNGHELQRLQVRVFVADFDAAHEMDSASDLGELLNLWKHVSFNHAVQRGGNVVELLRVRVITGFDQSGREGKITGMGTSLVLVLYSQNTAESFPY